MSAAARLSAFYGATARRAGASEHFARVCEVIGAALATRKSYSSTALRTLCRDRGVTSRWHDGAPGYGTIAAALDFLARAGLLSWSKAHVCRWHGPNDWKMPRAVKHKDGWRIPVRNLAAVGYAASLIAFAGLADACRAEPIDTNGNRLTAFSPCKNGDASRESESGDSRSSTPLSIGTALEAEPLESLRARWLPAKLRDRPPDG